VNNDADSTKFPLVRPRAESGPGEAGSFDSHLNELLLHLLQYER
jgi:hypothetical protein